MRTPANLFPKVRSRYFQRAWIKSMESTDFAQSAEFRSLKDAALRF